MKKIVTLMMLTSLLFSLAACGRQEPPVSGETRPAAETQQAQVHSFTGVLEDKKDFMITVSDGNQSYLFNLEGVVCPAEPGQTVTVTYTGDIWDFDSRLVAMKVEAN